MAILFLCCAGMLTRRSPASTKFWRMRASESRSGVCDKAARHKRHPEGSFDPDDLVDSLSHRGLELGIVAHGAPVTKGGLGLGKPKSALEDLDTHVGKRGAHAFDIFEPEW